MSQTEEDTRNDIKRLAREKAFLEDKLVALEKSFDELKGQHEDLLEKNQAAGKALAEQRKELEAKLQSQKSNI